MDTYSIFIYKTNKHFYVQILNKKKTPITGCSTNNKIVKSLFKKNTNVRYYKIFCLSKLLSSMIKSRNIKKIKFNVCKYKFKCRIKALYNYLIFHGISF